MHPIVVSNRLEYRLGALIEVEVLPLTRRTISESTVDELIKIVSEVALGVVSEVLEEYLEDILAMSNPDYICLLYTSPSPRDS